MVTEDKRLLYLEKQGLAGRSEQQTHIRSGGRLERNKMQIETDTVKKRTLFNKTRQYNIQIFYEIIFFKYRTRPIEATETNK